MTLVDHQRYEDMAAAFVLGALDAAERDEFKAHLATCDECRRDVVEMKETAAALPLGVPQIAPPPTLRARVLSAIADEQAPVAQPARALKQRSLAWPRLSRVQYALAASIAIVLLVGASFAGWAIGSRGDDGSEALVARSYDALSVMARADQRWNVQATSAAPGAWGVVAYDSRSLETSMVMWGLDETPGLQYNVWVTNDGSRARVGRLYAADGGFWAVMSQDVTAAESIGVTMISDDGGRADVLDTVLASR